MTAQDTPKNRQFERTVSRWLLIVFGGVYLLMILAELAVAAGWLQAAPIDHLFDSYKVVMLPLVTLVLGHYFGSRQ